jgi:hypothetical protein
MLGLPFWERRIPNTTGLLCSAFSVLGDKKHYTWAPMFSKIFFSVLGDKTQYTWTPMFPLKM